MSENTTPAACTDAEWDAATAAGLPFADPGSTAFERALHAFAQAMRHTPRAPEVPASHPDQRYFSGSNGDRWVANGVQVYRHARERTVDLSIRSYGGRFQVTAFACLTAAELREIAGRLLDAAHDLETVPAVTTPTNPQGTP